MTYRVIVITEVKYRGNTFCSYHYDFLRQMIINSKVTTNKLVVQCYTRIDQTFLKIHYSRRIVLYEIGSRSSY